MGGSAIQPCPNCATAVEGPYLRGDHWVLECKKCGYSMRHIMSEEQCIKSHNGYVSSKRDPECPWNEEYRCTYVGTDKCTVQCAHRRGVAKTPNREPCPLCGVECDVLRLENEPPRVFCRNPKCVGSKGANSKPEVFHIDTPKAPMHLLDLEFAAAMCDNFQRGIHGDRVANGWKDMEWSKEMHDKYTGAILRHLREYRLNGDPRQLAAIACNANIIWHHERKDV